MLEIAGGRANALWPYLARRVGAAYAAGARCLLLVPEQMTLQTEDRLSRELDLPGFFDIEVLSPSRLRQRVAALAGADGRVRIDAQGKTMALARALGQCEKKLVYYAGAAERTGFVARMEAMIGDCKRAGLSPQEVRDCALAREEGALREKLLDIAAAYEAYERQLAGRFVDGEDAMRDMIGRLPASGLARGAQVFVTGFDVLTGQMNEIVLALCREAAGVTAVLVMDAPDAPDGALYAPVRASARRLAQAARAAGVTVRAFYLDEPSGAHPELAHLSRYLFAGGAPAYTGQTGALCLYAAPTPYAEVHEAAQRILALNRQGVRFGEMAVIVGDMRAYGGLVATVFADYRIPVYVDEKQPAAAHALARFVLSALRAATGGFDAADVIACFKTGFSPLDDEQAFALENYALAYGVRGKRWLTPFTRGGEEERAAMEIARGAIIGPLEALARELRAARTAAESLTAVFSLLERAGAYGKLAAQAERLDALGLPAQAAQVRQVWQALLSLLDQMHALMGDARVPVSRIAAYLEAGLSSCELAALPPAPDAVLCGELGRAMPDSLRALMLLGLSDGALDSGGGALLSDEEQAGAQRALGAHLSLSADERADMRRLDLLKALAAPRDALLISHAQATQEGAALRPAPVLARIRRLFPQLREQGGVLAASGARAPVAPRPALDALAMRLRSGDLDDVWREAWAWLCAQGEWREGTRDVRRALGETGVVPPLSAPLARTLFGQSAMSVSRLEEFAACPYKHFVRYALAPQKRALWRIERSDEGSFYHAALEGFTNAARADAAWPAVTRERCDEMMDGVLAPLEAELARGPMADSARVRAAGERFVRTARRAAWTFTRHAQKSAFRPEGAEVRFGYEGGLPPIVLSLADGSRAYLRGVIDRIDVYGGEPLCLRVVDYKSGARELSPARVLAGLQLQLLLYLAAAAQARPGALPAGAFYFRVHDPLVSDDARLQEAAEQELAKALRLRGVALADAQILRAMDGGDPPESLPPLLRADGTPREKAPLCTLEQMRALLAHARESARRLADAMRAGEIDALPAAQDKWTACTYCDYAGICRRDARLRPERRALDEVTFPELVEKVSQACQTADHPKK